MIPGPEAEPVIRPGLGGVRPGSDQGDRGEMGVPCPSLTPLSEASGLGKGPILRLEGDGGQRLRAPSM